LNHYKKDFSKEKMLQNSEKYKDDIIHFTKYLKIKGNNINNVMITYCDDNYIDLSIDGNIFYTVTKKYYEDNIFKYDEFYNLGLIPKCIYQNISNT
jgi:hypothetical protein